MPNSLSFFRRTRKGKVLRIVKDQYLRDDVGCGTFMGRTLGNEDLARLVQDTCTSNPKKVLVVDTNVVLAQMDLLERGDDAITCVMVLQTVLQETRHRNLSLHRRLMELLKEEGRGFVYLANEHHGEMVIEKEDGESPNDMNDRAIRTAALWLQGQLSALDVTVILLSDDRMNVERAGKETLNAMSVQQLVTSLAGTHPGLQDLVALNEEGDAGDWSSSMEQVKEHLPMSELMAGIKSGKFHRGVLRAGRSWANGYVLVEGLGGEDRISVLIEGPRNVNRAMDGDVVAIEILLEAEAAKQIAANSNVSEEREADALDVLVPDLTLPPPLPTSAEQEQSGTGTLQPRGRVVGIVRRNSKPLCGTLDVSGDREAAGGVAVRALFVPLDKKLPKVRITTRQRGSLSHKRIVVMVDSWPAQSRYPIGHYVRSLGEVGDKATETEVILLEHDIAHEPFSQKVIACLPPTDWTITEENSRGRTDLRHLPVMSIDPPGCKDIDDALHSRSLPNGNIEVGVHIADVTYYVEAGSPLDDEAAARSTSTYLVDKRLDMLPKLLTETLCSLRSNVDRFAFSIVWELSPAGDIVDVAFFKSIIHSVGAFTYDEAQAMLDDPAAGSDICKSVKQLNVIAKLLRKRRMDAGALTLASPEVKFVLDSESQNPTDVQVYSLKDANALVEEFMLLANITVSKKILRHFPTLSVLRRHPSPSLKQFENLLLLAESAGVKLDVTDSKRLSHSLDGAVNEQDPYFNRLMRILTTRCMTPAQYFCSGAKSQAEWHHYGLATPIYTHFTSPIRRYADVLVHRLLSAAIGVAPMPLFLMDKAKVHDLVDNMNRKHRSAQLAGRASVALHTIIYFKQNPTSEDAYVLSIRRNAMSVLVPRFGIEVSIYFDASEPLLHVTEGGLALQISSPSGNEADATCISVLDKVRVKLQVLKDRPDEVHTELIEPYSEVLSRKREGTIGRKSSEPPPKRKGGAESTGRSAEAKRSRVH